MCELRHLGGRHSGPLQRHHILAKHLTRGSPSLRKASEVPELFASVCETCHYTRRAESKEARRYLLRQRAGQYGEAHMKALVNGLPWKGEHPELSWDSLTSGQ